MLTIHYTTDAVTMAKKEKEQTQYKTKDRATRTPLNTGVNLGAPEGYAVPAPLEAHVMLISVSPLQQYFCLFLYLANYFIT